MEKDRNGKWVAHIDGVRVPDVQPFETKQGARQYLEEATKNIVSVETVKPETKYESYKHDVKFTDEFTRTWSASQPNVTEYTATPQKYTPSQMGFAPTSVDWQRVEGNYAYTNRHIIDLGNADFYSKKIKNFSPYGEISRKAVDQLLESHAKSNPVLITPVAYGRQHPAPGALDYVVFEGDGRVVFADRKYIDHFTKLYGPDVTFKTKTDGRSSIGVYVDDKLIGLVMPLKLEGVSSDPNVWKQQAGAIVEPEPAPPEKVDEVEAETPRQVAQKYGPSVSRWYDEKGQVGRAYSDTEQASPEEIEGIFSDIEFTESQQQLLEELVPFSIREDIDASASPDAVRHDILSGIYGPAEYLQIVRDSLYVGRNLAARRDKAGRLVHGNIRRREMLTYYGYNDPDPVRTDIRTTDEERQQLAVKARDDKSRRVWFEPKRSTHVITKTAGDYLSQGEIDSTQQEWIDYADNVSQTEDHSKDVIISLYDFSGNWPSPWAHAGYQVHMFDVKSGFDLVRDFTDVLGHIAALKQEGYNIVGVLAAPPCEVFTVSSAKDWQTLHDDMNIAEVFRRYGRWAADHFDSPLEYSEMMVQVVEQVIAQANPAFWAMENPSVSRLKSRLALPDPALTFEPHNFGEDYTKRTALWGQMNVNLPTANAEPTAGSKIHSLPGSEKAKRQETPVSFAYSFFVAQHKALAAGDLVPGATGLTDGDGMVPQGADWVERLDIDAETVNRPEGEFEYTDLKATAEPTRKGTPEFMKISETNRPSRFRNLWSENGIDPDLAENWPLQRQFKEARRIMMSKYGLMDVVLGPGTKLNEAMDQLQDAYRNLDWMTHVLELPPMSMGLGGTLRLDLVRNANFLGMFQAAALGGGRIVLPGRSNSWAHEWGHALDFHLLNAISPGEYSGLSGKVRKDGTEPLPGSIHEAFVRVMDNIFFEQSELAADIMRWEYEALNGTEKQKAAAEAKLREARAGRLKTRRNRSDYYRSAKLYGEVAGNGDYWLRPTEMLARAFEAYVADRVAIAGGTHEFITKGNENYQDTTEQRLALTFPKISERLRIFEAFDMLFDQLSGAGIVAEGDPNAAPGSADVMDMRQFDAASEAAGLPKNFLRREIDAIVTESKALHKSLMERPSDSRGYLGKLEDVRQFWMSSLRARARTLEKRNPQSRALRVFLDHIVTAPGEARVVGETFIEEAQKRTFVFTSRYYNILKQNDLENLSTTQNDLLREILLGNEVEAPRNLYKAAAGIRQLFKQAYYDFKDVGLDIGVVNDKGYLTRYYDDAKIIANESEFVEDATRFFKEVQFELDLLGERNVAPEDRALRLASNEDALASYMNYVKRLAQTNEDVAAALHAYDEAYIEYATSEEADQDLLDMALSELIEETWDLVGSFYASSRAAMWIHEINMPDVHSPYSSSEAPAAPIMRRRQLAGEADDFLKEWMMTDVTEIVERYARSAARKIAFKKRFDDVKDVFAQLHAEGVSQVDIDSARRLFHLATGVHPLETPTPLQVTSDVVHAAGYMTLLAHSLLASLAEGGTYAIRTGQLRHLTTPMKMLWDAVTRSRTAAETRELGVAIGLIGHGATEATLMNRIGGEYQASVRTTTVMRLFFEKIGLTQLTQYQRHHGLRVFHAYTSVLARKWLAGKNRPEVEAELMELGIENFEAFSKWVLANGNKMPTTYELYDQDGRSTERGHEWAVAARRFVGQAIQDPDVTSRPEAANSALGRLMYGIMSFAYSFSENIIKREMKVIARKGALKGAAHTLSRTLPTVMGLVMHQTLISILREMIFHGDRYEEMGDEEKWRRMLQLGVSRSFGLGPIDPLLSYYQGLEYRRGAAETVVGPAPAYFLQNLDQAFSGSDYNQVRAIYSGAVLPLLITAFTVAPGGTGVRWLSRAGIHAAPGQRDNFAQLFYPRPDRRDAVDRNYSEMRGHFQDQLDEISTRLRVLPADQWEAEFELLKKEYPRTLGDDTYIQRYANTLSNRKKGRAGMPIVRGKRVQIEGLPKEYSVPKEIKVLSSAVKSLLAQGYDLTYERMFADIPEGLSPRLDTLRAAGRTGTVAKSELETIREELESRRRARRKEETAKLRRRKGES